ncbi:MAG TPA: DUF692 family protein [Flavobacteriales bacterium]|nr:DUF692 family protein [Flavobacteriales bacterium]
MIELATPISHLFKDEEVAKEIIQHSDVLECRDEEIDSNYPRQDVFHCELQIQHKHDEMIFSYLEKIKAQKSDLKLISFHMASGCTNPRLINGVYQVGGTELSRAQMKENATENVARFREIFGETILAVENNNFYPNTAYNYIADPDFIAEVVDENNLSFLFDTAHAKISAHNKQMEFEEYKNMLPLTRMIQVHICKPAIDQDNMAYDAHHCPDEDDLNEVKELLLAYKTIKYLTVEYYKDKENLINSLKQFKKLSNELH